MNDEDARSKYFKNKCVLFGHNFKNREIYMYSHSFSL